MGNYPPRARSYAASTLRGKQHGSPLSRKATGRRQIAIPSPTRLVLDGSSAFGTGKSEPAYSECTLSGRLPIPRVGSVSFTSGGNSKEDLSEIRCRQTSGNILRKPYNAPMLEIDRVSKRYDGTLAVDGASFSARPGRILGLLGPNGAGKTSILRMVNNITKPDDGQVRLFGEVVGRGTQSAIGYMPEERGLYKNVKVGEQLIYLARLKGLGKEDARRAAHEWLHTLEAGDWRDKKPTELSRGMQQKVQFALALVHAPRLIVLDEPFSGLDPLNSALVERAIAERKAAGAIVVFASHRMEQVEQLCDDICLIAAGRVLIAGDLAQVRRRFGRNTVRLGFDGGADFVAKLAAAGRVEVRSQAEGRAELRLLGDCPPSAVLDAARAEADSLHLFQASYPSLREIFLEAVGGANAQREAGETGEMGKEIGKPN